MPDYFSEAKTQFLWSFQFLGSITEAARVAGVNRSAHYDWLIADAQYPALFSAAKAKARKLAQESLLKAGIKKTKTPMQRPIDTKQYAAPAEATTAAIYIPWMSREGGQSVQALELREYAARRGWQVVEYCERKSKMLNRPVFRQLMQDSWRSKTFTVVLVRELSCFGCSLQELIENVALLRVRSIRFVSAEEGIDTDYDTRAGRTFLHALRVLTETEARMKTENVRAGIAAAKRGGVHCGRPRARVPLVQVRELRKQGLSLRAIATRIGISASGVGNALRREICAETSPLLGVGLKEQI
jgi:DNA invertase Pin-like site-specific DNA recombinase